MNLTKLSIRKSIVGAALIAASMTGLSSCDSVIYDDLPPCGVDLRFTYTYNMLYANAFPSKVDCLSVLIYDSDGNLVATRSGIPRDSLADENWRMRILPDPTHEFDRLQAGTYTVKAYGGMDGSETSFHFTGSNSTATGYNVEMNLRNIDADPGVNLHPLYFGESTFEIKPSSDDVLNHTYTVDMMRDTHNIRVLLQHVSGEPVDYRDFNFSITGADNAVFDASNAIIPNRPFTIYPWTVGNTVPPTLDTPQLAFAEFSTSRLDPASKMRLLITPAGSLASSSSPTISIPLIPYLLLLKSDVYQSMGAQEYLDRETDWSVIFFLDSSNNWVSTHIIVNDWVVRLNHAIV